MTNPQSGSTHWYSGGFWKTIAGYLGALRTRRRTSIADRVELETFLQTRAAHVAQTSLYGYLRTRAGTRFPELFSDDCFVESINIAKWQVWLACLSDLSVHAGILLRQKTGAPAAVITQLMQESVERILTDTGIPADAGADFVSDAERVRSRILLCDWSPGVNEEAAFSQSPAALVKWAPVTDDLKALDEEIVLNSVRFRWHEVQRELRNGIQADAVIAATGWVPAHQTGAQESSFR